MCIIISIYKPNNNCAKVPNGYPGIVDLGLGVVFSLAHPVYNNCYKG